MDNEKKSLLHEIANTVRQLSMEAIQKANSGHPGLPMGCAEIGAVLWGEFMKYNPKNPDWFNRDRFVLSAGHGSMFLYSLLHLSGYALTIEDIKRFRQMDSKTPGHPEKHETPGVEVTTGPLGQGVANAVGMALAYKILENRFNRDKFPIVSNKIICLAGDGCLMEGISSEASSLAGHLELNNLILIYDMNQITLDGEWKESCSDDQVLRYKSYGWDVIEVKNGNSVEEVLEAFARVNKKQDKPVLMIMHTVIGMGSPHKAGSHKAHGAPLGVEEVELTKKALHLPEEPFYVSARVREFFKEKALQKEREEHEWNEMFFRWKSAHPDLFTLFEKMRIGQIPVELEAEIEALPVEDKVAGRKVSQSVIQVLAKHLPFLIGGSADLSESDYTWIKDSPMITAGDFKGRNIKYGIREFSMTGMANGMATTFLRPFVGTFFCFSDYARNAIRLGCLSKHPTLLIYTHDSVGLGEDGPTHQPIEHLASLRAMPGLHLFRPGDAHEVKAAWLWAIRYKVGPVALILSRQAVPTLKETKIPMEEGVGRGAYILIKEETNRPIDVTLMATGSELPLAFEVCERLKKPPFKKNVRLVSMPAWRLFEEQPESYRKEVLGGNLGLRVSIELGTSFGWDRYIGPEGIAISIEEFGRSAPIADILQHFGFTPEQIIERILSSSKVVIERATAGK
ncbi:MAG: transketolase [Verrucomicrobia bacterium]|nr:transketolase [Verrucomicrobiota bacterium]